MFSQGSLQGLKVAFEASSSETIKLSFIIINFLKLMSLKLHNSFQTQVTFLETRQRYSFNRVKLFINTIHFQAYQIYWSRLSFLIAFFYFQTRLLPAQVESAQWAHFSLGHSRCNSRTSLSHRIGDTVTSHSVEP